MSACADKELLVHALADNELDAAGVLALEAHIAGCPGCAAELAAIRQLKAALGEAQPAYAAPEGFRARFEAALAETEPPPPRRRRGVSGETWVMGGSIAGDGTDFHDTVIDLRDFILQQTPQEVAMGTREDDLRTTRAVLDFEHDGSDTVMDFKAFIRYFLIGR